MIKTNKNKSKRNEINQNNQDQSGPIKANLTSLKADKEVDGGGGGQDQRDRPDQRNQGDQWDWGEVKIESTFENAKMCIIFQIEFNDFSRNFGSQIHSKSIKKTTCKMECYMLHPFAAPGRTKIAPDGSKMAQRCFCKQARSENAHGKQREATGSNGKQREAT